MDSKFLNDTIGYIIKDYRTKKGINAEKFAKLCDISKSLIYALEKGTYSGNLCNLTIEKIAIGMNLNYYELNDLIKQYTSKGINENNAKDEIIIYKNSKLYPLFNAVKDLSDENIEMLHSFALKLK